MSELERLGFIASLAKEASEKSPWMVGHTYFQKLVYLLQQGKGIPLGFNFRMHYYGPYSEALRGDLDRSVSLGIIERRTILFPAGYPGYDISITEKTRQFLEEEGGVHKRFESYKKDVQHLINFFAGKDARDLELLGTTCFVYDLLSPSDKSRKDQSIINMVTKRVRQLKPHFTEEQIRAALEELKSQGLLRN